MPILEMKTLRVKCSFSLFLHCNLAPPPNPGFLSPDFAWTDRWLLLRKLSDQLALPPPLRGVGRWDWAHQGGTLPG